MSDRTWREIVFNENTMVPISMILAVAPVALWLGALDAKVTAIDKGRAEESAATIKTLDYIRDQRQRGDSILGDRMREQDKVLREIVDRLGRIEGKLDSLRSRKD